MKFADYLEKDRAYLQAHQAATDALNKREIKAFSVKRDSDLGRVIHLETDQGWNPNPFYAEFEPEENLMAYI